MFDFLFNPNGRVSRKGIWLGLFFPQLIAAFVSAIADMMLFASAVSTSAGQLAAPALGLSALVSLFFLWPNIAVSVKRFHDRGMSGWWVLWFGLIVGACVTFALVSLVASGSALSGAAALEQGVVAAGLFPLLALLAAIGVCIAQFIILYLLPGQQGANRFGADPRDGGGRPIEVEGASSAWADRLADPARLAEVAKTARAKPVVAAAAVVVDPSALRGKDRIAYAFGTARQAAPVARASFGRRGM